MDSPLLEDLMTRARLSLREREAMRLDCLKPYTDQQLAEIMGCGIASVRTFRQRGRKKLRLAQAAYEAEQLGREDEDLDEEDLEEDFGLERFLLGAIIPRKHSDHGPNIGLTWTEYDLGLRMETTMAMEGGMHAGALVTPRDVRFAPRRRPIDPNPYGWDTPRFRHAEK